MPDQSSRTEETKKKVLKLIKEFRKEESKDFEQRLYEVEKSDHSIGHEVINMFSRTEEMDIHLGAVQLMCQDILEACDSPNPESSEVAFKKASSYAWAISVLAAQIDKERKDIHNSLCNIYDLVKDIHGWKANYRNQA